MAENIDADAEKRTDAFSYGTKEQYIGDDLGRVKKEMQNQSNIALITAEWEKYKKLSDEARRQYQDKLGVELEGTEFGGQNLDIFRQAILSRAADFGIIGGELGEIREEDESAFCALLKQGLKPHEAEYMGSDSWIGSQFYGKRRVVMPGGSEEVNLKDLPDFVRKARLKYAQGFEEPARNQLGEEWDKARESAIKYEAKDRVRKLAQTETIPEEKIKELYNEVRRKLVYEYIDRRNKTAPKETTPAEQKKINEEFGGGEPQTEAKKSNKAEQTEEGIPGLTGLENFGRKSDKDDNRMLAKFFDNNNIKVPQALIESIPPGERHKARQWKGGLLILIAKIMRRVFEPA